MTDSFSLLRIAPSRLHRERGVVLFFALMALVAISIAAIALLRAVDTNTLIVGNLALRQSAAASASNGTEAALTALTNINAAAAGKDAFDISSGSPLNADNPAIGYYSWANPNLNLFDNATWDAAKSVLVGTDAAGNTQRYIIERLCRNKNEALDRLHCLFGGTTGSNGEKNTPTLSSYCSASNTSCPTGGPQVLYRITVRSQGPRNTNAYVQAFVY